MKTLTLPTGTPYVRFDELAQLIAYALHQPKDDDSAGDGLNYGFALVSLEAELRQAVESGALPAKNPLTLGPHVMHVDRLEDARVRVSDLQAYLGDRVFVEQADANLPPLVQSDIDFTMVATRKELIDAFGTFTGMDMTWFDNLKDTPKLMAARKFTGQGGRNSAEPLFCPYEVMQWLADPKRRKGKSLTNETAWRLFKRNFGKVYNRYSVGDPNPD